jgi:uncharacterized protein
MKKLKCFLSAVMILMAVQLSAQTTEGKSDTINRMNDKNMKTGYWVERSGEFTNIGYYVDNMKTGNWMTLLSNDLMFKLEYFTNNVKNGISLQFDRRAKLTTMENYKNGELHGLCVYYGPYNDAPQKEANYANGKLDGLFRNFYETGKIQEESFYRNNQKSGPSRWYNKDGRLIAMYNYVNGQFDGVQRTYYENDTTQTFSMYGNNVLNGDYKEYYRNGKLKVSGKYMNGIKEGTWTEYDETGKVAKVLKYKNGEAK